MITLTKVWRSEASAPSLLLNVDHRVQAWTQMELPTPRELQLEALLRRRDEQLARLTVRYHVYTYCHYGHLLTTLLLL